MALDNGPPEAAQLVACECVVEAETKDHLNWELIHEVAGKAKGEQREALKAAYELVEEQEDQHLYHTTGWCRELWIESLGMPAVLPPPEEEKEVETAIGAARAKKARKEMRRLRPSSSLYRRSARISESPLSSMTSRSSGSWCRRMCSSSRPSSITCRTNRARTRAGDLSSVRDSRLAGSMKTL